MLHRYIYFMECNVFECILLEPTKILDENAWGLTYYPLARAYTSIITSTPQCIVWVPMSIPVHFLPPGSYRVLGMAYWFTDIVLIINKLFKVSPFLAGFPSTPTHYNTVWQFIEYWLSVSVKLRTDKISVIGNQLWSNIGNLLSAKFNRYAIPAACQPSKLYCKLCTCQ